MNDEYRFEELEEAARALYSSSTAEVSEYPDSKDKLFTARKDFWHLNACISSYNEIGPYVAGYLDAAKILARIVIYSGRGMDTLAYPIIYLYRHFLEIKLKHLIRCGSDITDEPIDKEKEKILNNGHDLKKLWDIFKPFFQEVSGHNDNYEAVREGMESYIDQIHNVDPKSFAFRYDRPGNLKTRYLEGIEYINILHFCETIEKLTDILEGISCEFDEALNYVNEMKREYSQVEP